MPSLANQNPLWKAAFATHDGPEHSAERERLANTLLRMSDSVEQLLKMVPSDCRGLTLHDITHLDAVWEMAAMIAGDDYPLNPAETFVLGGAILLHDAGLTAASYENGIEDIVRTQVWKDISSSELRQAGVTVDESNIIRPPAPLFPTILFSALRELHASQAEKMATGRWTLPGLDDIYLIEDVELRQAFGESIGRIAHSHHWSVERVATDLRDHVGVGTSLPSEWAISERKLACILRCADAAHIDRRRAPTILFAATKPVKVSHNHWLAQNRINKPSVDGSTLIYTAGSTFEVDEADAWWLTYDLVKLVDKEIRSSNALLEELQFNRMRVTRVLGAENPRALSSQIRTNAWQPIDAEVRVSDPVHLALTLGGRNLYGRDPIAPIREVMQNAADAIRARRALDEREDTWGTIVVTIEPEEGADSCFVHIDDDGIGMTERVMSGPLIDFGKSIWNSDLLRSEFPGLQSKNVRPIGKFGIGFFSIFELADDVKVVSKHYERGVDDARVLEFRSLSARPHIRAAKYKELPRDTSTRVSFRVKDKRRVSGNQETDHSRIPFERHRKTFSDEIVALLPLLDVRVLYHNKVDGTSFEHAANVYDVSAAAFLDEVLVGEEEGWREQVKRNHASRLSILRDENGLPYGRAALAMFPRENYRRGSERYGTVSVGGFVYRHGSGLPVPYVGVVEGSTEEAARQSAYSRVSGEAVAAWATEQGELIDQTDYLKQHLIEACQSIIEAGGDPKSLPYCFHGGRLINLQEAKGIINQLDDLFVLIEPGYGENFTYLGYNAITPILSEVGLDQRVFVIGSASAQLFDAETGKIVFKWSRRQITVKDLSYSSTAFREFIKIVADTWGMEPKLTVRSKQVFNHNYKYPPDSRWIVEFSKAL